MRVVGVQDYPMKAAAWMDERNKIAWLRALEELAKKGHDTYAIVREHHYDHRMSAPIRGITYIFASSDDAIPSLVSQLRPAVVMYNNCCYAKLPGLLQAVRDTVPDTKQIVRTQHEVKRVLNPKLIEQLLGIVDELVVSSFADLLAIEAAAASVSTPVPVHVIPIGAQVGLVRSLPNVEVRDIDFAASCSSTERLAELQQVFAELTQRGYTCCNIVGEQRQDALNKLKRTRVFVSTSLSEGSGSRVLLEAIAAGAHPVVQAACESAVEVVDKLGGAVLDMQQLSTTQVADSLEHLWSTRQQPMLAHAPNLDMFSDSYEVARLIDVLSNILHAT